MKRISLIVISLSLLSAACGSPGPELDSAPIVADVLGSAAAAEAAAVTTTPPSPSVPPGCRLVVERDEYGFEVEVVKCDEAPPAPEDPDWLGSQTARQAATMLVEALVVQAECGSRVSYGELKTLVAEAIAEYREPLLSAIAALEQGSAHCNKDKDAWAAAMSAAIVELEEFLRAVENNTSPPAAEETP